MEDEKAYHQAIGSLRYLFDDRQRISPNMKVYLPYEIITPQRPYSWEFEILSIQEVMGFRSKLRIDPLYTLSIYHRGKCLSFDIRIPEKIPRHAFEKLIGKRVRKEYQKWEKQLEEEGELFTSWLDIPFRGIL